MSGSDQKANYSIDNLRRKGIDNIHVGQSAEQIAQIHQKSPIDWFVYTSSLAQDHPELAFCKKNRIRASRRDELLNEILSQNNLKLVAVAGTHGKTTTTAMLIWLFGKLEIPVSFSVGAKVGNEDMGHFDPKGQYFIYEADEYDHNFLAFHPFISLISGIDWDHPDTYPTRKEYYKAFRDFINQSQHTVLWRDDSLKLGVSATKDQLILEKNDRLITKFKLAGIVNRQNAWLAAKAIYEIVDVPLDQLVEILNKFPGLSRRFEEIAPNIYTDYAHTPPKIRGALQLAQEVAGDNVVVVYEGIHNLRQHFIKEDLKNVFDDVKQLYIIPTYLAREDPNLPILSTEDLKGLLSSKSQTHTQTALLNQVLKNKIKAHAQNSDLVLCFSAGGAGGIDEWLRKEFS